MVVNRFQYNKVPLLVNHLYHFGGPLFFVTLRGLRFDLVPGLGMALNGPALDGLAVLSIELDKADQMNHRAVAKSFANANVQKVFFFV